MAKLLYVDIYVSLIFYVRNIPPITVKIKRLDNNSSLNMWNIYFPHKFSGKGIWTMNKLESRIFLGLAQFSWINKYFWPEQSKHFLLCSRYTCYPCKWYWAVSLNWFARYNLEWSICSSLTTPEPASVTASCLDPVQPFLASGLEAEFIS